ncbi:IPT/TIG domain-containing protein [Pseudoxanthomonas sp.]|uniref:IPT/TIG domain-containing protein n=1 Tax=Pseudoxanthomonas sp. TaxID=1871049 RepID=UPI003F7D8292
MKHAWKIMVAFVIAGVVTSLAGAATYSYDANGRLVLAANEEGGRVRYVYDAVGNLRGIERLRPDELAILDVEPGRGAPGARVLIRGQGFSATAMENRVEFNGTVAEVTDASPTSLAVLVPAGATTGLVRVDAKGASAVSPTAFIVDENEAPPVIHRMAPLRVAVGATVGIDGENLTPIPGQSSVHVAARPVMIAEGAKGHHIDFVVPANASSGKVTVTTPFGRVRSSEDLVVVPAGISPADVETVHRIEPGATPISLNVSSPGKWVVVLFDGKEMEHLSVQTDLGAGVDIEYTVRGPANRVHANGALSARSASAHLPTLKEPGTYAIFMKRLSNAGGWRLSMEVDPTLEAGGNARTFENWAAGQSKRFLLPGRGGDNLGLGISELSVGDGSSYANARVYRPDGKQLRDHTCYLSSGDCQLNLQSMAAGAYAAVVQSGSGGQHLRFKATLSADVAGRLVPDAWQTLVLDRIGRNGRLSFTGTAGQRSGIQVADQKTMPVNREVYYYVYAPDGSLFTSRTIKVGGTLDLPALPVDGTYQLFVDPAHGETLTVQLRLATGTIEGLQSDTGQANYAANQLGEAAYFTFVAKEGDNLGLGISELMLSEGSYAYVHVSRPDGRELRYAYCYASNGGCDLNLPELKAGTYAVVVKPSAPAQQMRFKATLSSDLIGQLTPDVWKTLVLGRPGQNARLSFTGIAGQRWGVQGAEQQTMPVNRRVYYRVYAPDGGLFRSTHMDDRGDALDLPPLPIDGTYQVFIDPEYGGTLTTQLRLSTGTTEGMQLDEEQGTYAAREAGEAAYFTFTAKEGDNLGFGISDLLTTEGVSGYVYVRFHDPSGHNWKTEACYAYDNGAGGTCGVNLPSLSAGSYAISVTPGKAGQKLRFKATLSSDLKMQLVPDEWMNLVLGRPGQNGRLRFDGVVGQRLGLQISGQRTLPAYKSVNYRVHGPDGKLLTSRSLSDSATLDFSALPSSGTYEVFVDPVDGRTLNAQLRLATGTAEGMEQDGESGTYVSRDDGEVGYFTFKANAGDNLGLGIHELEGGGPGSGIRIQVYPPDGSWHPSDFCYTSWGSCGINLSNLKATGTYAVLIVPEYSKTPMRYRITLSRDKVGRLPLDQWTALALPRPGQNGRLTFAGSVGQQLILQINGQETTPAGKYVYYRVHGPDGALLQSGSASGNTWLKLPVLPVSGDYQVFVDPSQGASATLKLRLDSGVDGELIKDAEPRMYERTHLGEASYFTFLAQEGDHLGLGIRDVVTAEGREGYFVRVYVYRPNGSRLIEQSCYMRWGGCGLNLPNLKAGAHKVVVEPEWPGQRIRFRIALSSDLTSPLVVDEWKALVLGLPGQNGRLSFIGTTGQRLGLQIVGQKTAPADRTVYYHVYAPDGSLVKSTSLYGHADVLDLPPLPMDGTYQVLVDPLYGETLSVQLRLATGTVGGKRLNAGPITHVADRPDDAAYLTFTANAGDNLGLGFSELLTSKGTRGYAYVWIHGPDGSHWKTKACHVHDEGPGGTCGVNLTNLRAGIYAAVVKAEKPNRELRFTATLSADVTDQLVSDRWTTLVLRRSGQNGWLSFTGVAGQRLDLQIAGQQTSPARGYVYYDVYAPDGTRLASKTVYADGTMALPVLPVNGTYRVFVDPDYGETLTTQLRLVTRPSLSDLGRVSRFSLADTWRAASFQSDLDIRPIQDGERRPAPTTETRIRAQRGKRVRKTASAA